MNAGSILMLAIVMPVLVMAQESAFQPPVKLGATINTEAEEGLPLLSADGQTLYFTRVLSVLNKGGRLTGADVWKSTRNARGSWAVADNVSLPFNDDDATAVIGTGATPDVLYIMKTTGREPCHGIFSSRKTKGAWSSPALIRIPGIENLGFLGFHVTTDSSVIFISMKKADGFGEEDLYFSVKNATGEWTVPKNLGPAVNSTGFELSPFLSADKNRLYFASNGHGGFGDADIFYCERLFGSWETWSVPKNLGEQINSPFFDGYFSVYGDTLAFFASNRAGGLADIYSAEITSGGRSATQEQRSFLTTDQVARLSGKKFPTELSFQSGATDLADDHLAVLDAAAQSFADKSEIALHLVAYRSSAADAVDVYQERLVAILTHLKRKGIPGARITWELQISEVKAMADQQVVEVRFYKAN